MHAAFSAPDTDWVAKLTLVHPGGASVIISGGILRARYRCSLSRSQPLEPNNPKLFEIEMTATATVIPAGHRLHLTLASSDFLTFARNLNTGGPIGRERCWQTAINLLFHDRLGPRIFFHQWWMSNPRILQTRREPPGDSELSLALRIKEAA